MEKWIWTADIDQEDEPNWMRPILNQAKYKWSGSNAVSMVTSGGEYKVGTVFNFDEQKGAIIVQTASQIDVYLHDSGLTMDDVIESLPEIPKPLQDETVRSALNKIHVRFQGAK